jgi:hypothetical protein
MQEISGSEFIIWRPAHARRFGAQNSWLFSRPDLLADSAGGLVWTKDRHARNPNVLVAEFLHFG